MQTGYEPNDDAWFAVIPLLCRAYVEAVAAGDPFAHRLGLDLADAAWRLADSAAVAIEA